MQRDSRSEFFELGYCLADSIIPLALFEPFYDEVRAIASSLAPGLIASPKAPIDDIWLALSAKDRRLAGNLYDAVKHSIAIREIALSPKFLFEVRRLLKSQTVAFVDLNIRIDGPGEGKYLFGWHQDYWFGICSTQAMVAWIPLVELDSDRGGIEVIANTYSGGRIYKAKRNPLYDSYSNSVLIDEPVDEEKSVQLIPHLGDCIFFKYNVLHKSMPNASSTGCRWTLQARFVDYADDQFRKENYRMGVVSPQEITYLKRIESHETN